MELVKIFFDQALRNAPKGLSSEFHPNRSKTKGTSFAKTANGDDPLASQMG